MLASVRLSAASRRLLDSFGTANLQVRNLNLLTAGRCLQAVMYFRRALKLDPSYLSAWTLMGHEYVEMKNTPAAIGGPSRNLFCSGRCSANCRIWCRRHICSNFFSQHLFSISAYLRCFPAEAYRRAVDLSPRDYRAWYGLGQTYELLRMPYYALYYFRRWLPASDVFTCRVNPAHASKC